MDSILEIIKKTLYIVDSKRKIFAGRGLEIYYAYCFPFGFNSWHTPRVKLFSKEEVLEYCEMHKGIQHNIRVFDSLNAMIVEMKNGSYIFPEEWRHFNKSK